jgi:uncharacterized protein
LLVTNLLRIFVINTLAMETPFIYGRLATDQNFTDRTEEIKHLFRNFSTSTNTILISPRRWGKSSLVKKAVLLYGETGSSTRFVFIDMFNVRTEEEFYKELLEKSIQAVSGKIDDVIGNITKFMKRWTPEISVSTDSEIKFKLNLNWMEVKKNPDEILDLPEKIAAEKGLRLIVCIDEFQNISYFDDPLAFQKKLRSHWQHHKSATYCLYGSKRHMMMDVFTSPAMPFYKFGDLIFLAKIRREYWILFIEERFHATGKTISNDQAGLIAGHVDDHPYYVQQLAQLVWLRTRKKVTDEDISLAWENLILQMSMLFQNLTEMLATSQMNFLKAVINKEKQLSSKEIIKKYNLGTSANVVRLKRTLISKEIVDEDAGKVYILDPLFASWLKNNYFGGTW